MLVVIILSWSLLPGTGVHALGDNYVAPPFRAFYYRHDGMRLLGPSISGMLQSAGTPVQYFEKGRLEDHRNEVGDPSWAISLGRLTVELISSAPQSQVNDANITYADLARLSQLRHEPPTNFTGGTAPVEGGIFVPFDPLLQPTFGYIVAPPFWAYLDQAGHFPTGWLHAVGLPITDAFEVETMKHGGPRIILMQAFERAVLTFDALNPPAWQVEQGNLGLDVLRTIGRRPGETSGYKRIVVDLSDQWLYTYAGDELVFDTGVSTGRDGWETPTGRFAIYLKLRSQTMTGSRNGEQWVVPDVPHVMYIYRDVALHGTYWHDQFGTGLRLSHGCINLSLEAARLLFAWAPVGTPVYVQA
jgi:hypothetical protein